MGGVVVPLARSGRSAQAIFLLVDEFLAYFRSAVLALAPRVLDAFFRRQRAPFEVLLQVDVGALAVPRLMAGDLLLLTMDVHDDGSKAQSPEQNEDHCPNHPASLHDVA